MTKRTDYPGRADVERLLTRNIPDRQSPPPIVDPAKDLNNMGFFELLDALEEAAQWTRGGDPRVRGWYKLRREAIRNLLDHYAPNS